MSENQYSDPKNPNSKTSAGIKRRWVGEAKFDVSKLPEALRKNLEGQANTTAPREDKTKKK